MASFASDVDFRVVNFGDFELFEGTWGYMGVHVSIWEYMKDIWSI